MLTCVQKKQNNKSSTENLNAPVGMVWIPGGEFTMGTNDPQSYDHEKPAHRVKVDGFWMDETEVTNLQFKIFTDATNYVTTAEKAPD
jgi:formylglycine-generating enzyme